MVRKVILDCDTGTDDAIAIMLAALHPKLELLGVSTVWGNHCVAATTDNTLRVLDHVGRSDIPVYAGLDAPADDRPMPLAAASLEGGALPLPAARSAPAQGAAVDWLAETARAHHDSGDELTIVGTGPLTNLAAAMATDPGFAASVHELVVMGGTRSVRTSVTPYAERNVWNDPLAFQAVLDAGFDRLTLVTLDATYQALMGQPELRRLEVLETPAASAAASFVVERIADYRDVPGMDGRAPVHDPLAVAMLLDPGVVTAVRARVSVDLADSERYGQTNIDLDSASNAQVALSSDPEALFALLQTAFA